MLDMACSGCSGWGAESVSMKVVHMDSPTLPSQDAYSSACAERGLRPAANYQDGGDSFSSAGRGGVGFALAESVREQAVHPICGAQTRGDDIIVYQGTDPGCWAGGHAEQGSMCAWDPSDCDEASAHSYCRQNQNYPSRCHIYVCI